MSRSTILDRANVTNTGVLYAINNDPQEAFDPMKVFYNEVSPNAILNKGGRADDVRCHPGTRKKVISDIEGWMALGYLEDRRIFWLSGPAGAGKSAIVQTVAENCLQRKAPMVNFFFFRADGSRAHSRPVVATLLYQLFNIYPDLKAIVRDIISQDRLIFKKPLREQFQVLIYDPICSMRREPPAPPPIIILIDGLDECDSRPELDIATKSEQTALLRVLHEFSTLAESPFVALIASRVEPHIQMAFNTVGYAKRSIDLDKRYKPDDDIRRFTSERLIGIKQTHPLRQHLDTSWPSESIIDTIVQKSSGQFIYASTVLRFLESSSQSPAISIEMVLSLRSANKRSPFAALDAIYTFILSRCEHLEHVRTIMAAHIIRSGEPLTVSSVGYSPDEVESFFADLTPIIKIEFLFGLYISIEYHHASFGDFLASPERAGCFHIDSSVAAHILIPWPLLRISDYPTFSLALDVLGTVNQRTEPLTHALTRLPPRPEDCSPGNTESLFRNVKRLYATDDVKAYRQILERMKEQGWIAERTYQSEKESSSRVRRFANAMRLDYFRRR